VNDALRAAVQNALNDLGLGVTSPELGVSRETVRNLLNGTHDRFNLGVLARLCISLELTAEDVEHMALRPLAREMTRLTKPAEPDNVYAATLMRTMEPRRPRSPRNPLYTESCLAVTTSC